MIWTSGSVGLCKSNNLKILFNATRCLASKCEDRSIKINDKIYEKDSMSNITPKILSHLNRNLHMQKQHPLSLIKENIVNYMYGRYKPSKSNRGMPLFSVQEDVSPIVRWDAYWNGKIFWYKFIDKICSHNPLNVKKISSKLVKPIGIFLSEYFY